MNLSDSDYLLCCAKSLQLCLSLWDPMDCSPSGSSFHGDSPGKNTGVSCHVLLQWIKPVSLVSVALAVDFLSLGFFITWEAQSWLYICLCDYMTPLTKLFQIISSIYMLKCFLICRLIPVWCWGLIAWVSFYWLVNTFLFLCFYSGKCS